MPEDASKLNCEAFQSQLGELLASGADIANRPHARACEGCCGFIRDLYRIAENSRQFRFGTHESDTDDWSENT